MCLLWIRRVSPRANGLFVLVPCVMWKTKTKLFWHENRYFLLCLVCARLFGFLCAIYNENGGYKWTKNIIVKWCGICAMSMVQCSFIRRRFRLKNENLLNTNVHKIFNNFFSSSCPSKICGLRVCLCALFLFSFRRKAYRTCRISEILLMF